MQQLIENGNAYEDAAAQQAEYLTNLFSGVADDISTSMVDAFIESGDAANGLGDIISDVSKQMVADLIKSVYLMPILSGYTKQFEAIQNSASMTPTEKTEAQLRLLDDALQQISGQSANINEPLRDSPNTLAKAREERPNLARVSRASPKTPPICLHRTSMPSVPMCHTQRYCGREWMRTLRQ